MPHYCDSAALEFNWARWLVSSRVPLLEEFRCVGLLWTRLVGDLLDKSGQVVTKHGRPVKDLSHKVREHCIATAKPIHFRTIDGVVDGEMMVDGKPISMEEAIEALVIDSNSPIHDLEGDLLAQRKVVAQLATNGFFKELPTKKTWDSISTDVNNICLGMAIKFRQNSEEERFELSHETFIQVATKMKNYKLVFTPGLAPVFNLLTTTVYRCMCSIMNRRTAQRRHIGRLIQDAKDGAIISSNRSLRAYSGTTR